MLGLPEGIRALLFDLDGVLTPTAVLHAQAWKEMFDAYLRAHAGDGQFRPFDIDRDYDEYVDGKPRYDGVRDFLRSRGITLPEGRPEDPPDRETVSGLGNRKNDLVQQLIDREGVSAYPGSRRYLEAARGRGLPMAVVSSSANCRRVLQSAGIEGFFSAVVDGETAHREGLQGKPAPDTFLAAARHLGVEPAAAAVFEDALAGVEAGHAGGFGAVVGVDRHGQPDALSRHGATRVVGDLGDLLGDGARG